MSWLSWSIQGLELISNVVPSKKKKKNPVMTLNSIRICFCQLQYRHLAKANLLYFVLLFIQIRQIFSVFILQSLVSKPFYILFISFLFLLFFFSCWDRVSLCNPGCSWTYYVAQADLKLLEILLSQPPKAGITGLYPYAWLFSMMFYQLHLFPHTSRSHDQCGGKIIVFHRCPYLGSRDLCISYHMWQQKLKSCK